MMTYLIYGKQDDLRESPLGFIAKVEYDERGMPGVHGFAHALEFALKRDQWDEFAGRRPKEGELVIVKEEKGPFFKVYMMTGKNTFNAPWCD